MYAMGSLSRRISTGPCSASATTAAASDSSSLICRDRPRSILIPCSHSCGTSSDCRWLTPRAWPSVVMVGGVIYQLSGTGDAEAAYRTIERLAVD